METLKKKKFLFDLLGASSPSGYETLASNVFTNFCGELGMKHEFTDSIGNVAFSVGNGKVPFMISGHIDEVGLQVQHIDKDGFIYFIKDGGSDPKIMPGSSVEILTNSGTSSIYGIIGKSPIHIEYHTENKDKAIKMKNLKIDIGARSKEEAMKYVSIGDPIVFVHPIFELLSNRIATGSIDDKVGVYVTAMVLNKFKECEETKPLKNIKLYGVACTQEEVGGNGATIASKRINPAYSIDYDVTFATDDGCVSEKEWGDIKIGEGGCIAYGPDKNREMCDLMKKVCEKIGLKHQPFSVGAGMTNTLKIKMAADDCKTLLLSIPERNMHTPVEVCSFDDLESLVNMTYYFIREIDLMLEGKNSAL